MLVSFDLYLMSILYFFAGVMHFWKPRAYLPIMPPWLPYHMPLIYISGAAEILLAILLLVPSLKSFAAIGIILLLLAVFPANIHMWINQVPINGKPWPLWAHALRIPLQFALMYWAYTHINTSISI